MTKEEIQKNSEHWYNKYKELEKENRLLGERCNQLLKDKGDLIDQIADIKANCDLAIEGRDIKISELEDHLAEEVELHLHAEEYIKSLEQQIEKMKTIIKKKYCKKCPYRKDNEMFLKIAYDENKKLKEQIEKMKCCSNCNHFNKESDIEYCQNCERQLVNSLDNLSREKIIKDEWEIKK